MGDPLPTAAPHGDDAPRPSALPGLAMTTAFLMLLWLCFSDKYDLFHLGSGLVSAALVAWFSHDLLCAGVRTDRRGKRVLYYHWSFRWHRLVIFLPWLIWKIAIANLQVARLVLSPRMPIDPSIFVVSTGLQTDVARLALASTITLTPGTIVVNVVGDTFTVHKIHPSSATDVLSGAMIEMIRATFDLDGVMSGPPRGDANA